MRHIATTVSGHHDTHGVGVAVFWIVAGITIVIAFGDALAVLAVAIAISWMYRKVEHRLERTDAETAPVTCLRPGSTGQRDLKDTPARASHRFRRAA
jgi:hypothetical protein